jgi:hypothetical protein
MKDEVVKQFYKKIVKIIFLIFSITNYLYTYLEIIVLIKNITMPIKINLKFIVHLINLNFFLISLILYLLMT